MIPHGAPRHEKAARDLRSQVRAIRARMRDGEHPLILLVSGVHGIGKTTLSHELSRRLGVRQRVGLGAIVKTLIEFGVPGAEEMDNVLDFGDPTSQLDLQARTLCRVVDRLVRTYHAQGIHCVIDGVQLLPQYLHLPPGAIHIHLAISDIDVYLRQVREANPRKYGAITERTAAALGALDRALSLQMSASQDVVVLRHRRPVLNPVSDAIRAVYERYAQGGTSLCSGNE